MAKHVTEIRDPIHVFIKLDSDELKVLNSRPFQRLRHIHQLAMTYLVYPGATHRRFEHSLGVMELAGRVYDVVTEKSNINEKIKDLIPQLGREAEQMYWRRVLRIAALCHDMGHLPFSHAAEKDLLPNDWNHERLTIEIIRSNEMKQIWDNMTPPLRTEDIVKIAVGPKELKGVEFSDWEAILSEIIVGDAFGVDRMDYLLRDSHHAGVAYGKFDHFRLIDTLRILPKEEGDSIEPALGVEEGGLHSAEALLLARYFMYTQLYFHPVRKIYDLHLKDFLAEWLPSGKFSIKIEDLLNITDNEVTSAMLKAARKTDSPGHYAASSIINRQHFRVIYQRNPEDIFKNLKAPEVVYDVLKKRYGEGLVKFETYKQKGSGPNFPVMVRDGRIVSSLATSETLKNLPVVAIDFVFISPECRREAQKWLQSNLESIIKVKEEV